jgi:hypothetical protein
LWQFPAVEFVVDDVVREDPRRQRSDHKRTQVPDDALDESVSCRIFLQMILPPDSQAEAQSYQNSIAYGHEGRLYGLACARKFVDVRNHDHLQEHCYPQGGYCGRPGHPVEDVSQLGAAHRKLLEVEGAEPFCPLAVQPIKTYVL